MSITIVAEKCCGCRVCVSECPINAIKFCEDDYGFEYPRVDDVKCIECGKCELVCPALHNPQNGEHLYCGAAYAKDNSIKYNGSSGGLFGLFARKIIEDGGVAYGAAFDEYLKLKTKPAKTVNDLIPLYKSKYLLCDTDYQFTNIKSELDNGKKVLYCSSPCQIAALKLYLKKNYENLITVDFVCHGVGSQSMFLNSVHYIEQKKKIKIKEYTFRYKKGNATSHYFCVSYEKNGKINCRSSIYLFDPYYTAYQKRIACRKSCYDCRYAAELRSSDLTIGDFHTINQYYPKIDRFAGVSMFVCNTVKGYDFFRTVSEKMEIREMEWEELKRNNRFSNSEKMLGEREEFLLMAKNEGFSRAADKFLSPSLNWIRIIYYYSPKFIRKIALRIIGNKL